MEIIRFNSRKNWNTLITYKCFVKRFYNTLKSVQVFLKNFTRNKFMFNNKINNIIYR